MTGGYSGLVRAALAAQALCNSALLVQGGGVTTTIYVGRHFEVRDHDQPTKYVFDGSTRVAEITGSLSSNLRVQRLRLYSGWNLCSLAVSGPFPATGAEAISTAYQWNSGTGDYSRITLGQSLAAGTVLWIKAGTNADVSVLGTYSDPAPQSVQAGGAYFPGAGLEVWSPALPDAASSWDFDASTGQWLNHLAGDLASVSGPPPTLSPGEAFYLQSGAAASLEIPDPTLRIRYYHQDHLGSSSVITDADGARVEETAFYPSGSERDGFKPREVHEPYRFIQKELDRESGLHYLEARFLRGVLSRFSAVDFKYANPDRLSTNQLGWFLYHPQMLNAYDYAANNPIRWTDPTGLDPGDPFPSADDAAKDVLKMATTVSIYFNTEYGGWIYKRSGKFYATFPTEGEASGTEWNGSASASSAPAGSQFVGKYHTHGDYSIGHQVPDPKNPAGPPLDIIDARTSDPKNSMFSGDEFSIPDIMNGQLNARKFPGWGEYLGTPSGDFLKSTGRSQTIIGHVDRPFGDLAPAEAKEQLDFLSSITP